MRNTAFLLSALAIIVAGSACTPKISPDTYSVGSVGQVNRVVRGTIVSSRLVAISGTQSGAGAATGIAAGGVAGSAMGGNTRTNVLGAIGGAVVGGIAGAAIEESSTRQQGMEYVVETENGALLTVVQGTDPSLSVGQRVLVMYGQRARVIADTR